MNKSKLQLAFISEAYYLCFRLSGKKKKKIQPLFPSYTNQHKEDITSSYRPCLAYALRVPPVYLQLAQGHTELHILDQEYLSVLQFQLCIHNGHRLHVVVKESVVELRPLVITKHNVVSVQQL